MTTIASTIAPPATRCRPAGPSSSVSSSTSWSYRRAATAMDDTNCMTTATSTSGRSGTTSAMTRLRLLASARARWFGRYPSRVEASCTRARVAAEMVRLPLSTYDTVLVETPASRATSAMVTTCRSSSRGPTPVPLTVPGTAPPLDTPRAALPSSKRFTWTYRLKSPTRRRSTAAQGGPVVKRFDNPEVHRRTEDSRMRRPPAPRARAVVTAVAVAAVRAVSPGAAARAAAPPPAGRAQYPFRAPSLPVQARVDDLLGRLTVDEKIGLLHQYEQPIPRLGIGLFKAGTEALHGVAWSNDYRDNQVVTATATTFPQAVGLASTWDPALVRRVGSAVGDEARGLHAQDPSVWGLDLWAPVVNPLRDPRWGRNEEGYSEDPRLTSTIATAYGKGIQGDDPTYL